MLKQRWRIALNLFTLLAVVSNGWLYAIPRVMAETNSAETDSVETMEMVDNEINQPTLDSAVARQLLEQIQLATDDLQDSHSRTQVLSAVARSYSEMSDEATAVALLNQVLLNNQKGPDTPISNLYLVLNAASNLSDQTVTVDLFHQLLDASQQLPTDDDKSSLQAQITYFANQLPADVVHDLMGQILTASQSTENSIQKVRVLTGLAAFYTTASDEAKAIDLLSQALVAVDTIDAYENSRYHAVLDVLYQTVELSNDTAKVDILDQTLPVINNLQEQEFKAQALVHASLFAQELSNTSQANQLMAEALTLAESLPNDWAKSTALYVIANNYKDEFNQRNTKDLLSRVLNAAGEIQEDQYKLGGLLDVVSLASRLSNQTVAKQLLAQALTIVNGFENSLSQAQGLLSIAESYRVMSDEATVRDILLQVLTLTNTIEDPYSQRSILQQFVSLSARLTDSNISQDLLSQGLTFVRAEQDMELQASMLMSLSEIGQETLAGVSVPEPIRQALMLVDEIQAPDAKAEALSQAAQTLYYMTFSEQDTTDWGLLQTTLSQVLEGSRHLPDSETKMITFLMLGYAISELPAEVAAPLTEQFIAVTKEAKTARGQGVALSAIANIQSNHSQNAAAQQTLGQALSLVSSIEDANAQMAVIYRIAEVVSQLSEQDAIYSLTRQMLTIVAELEEDSAKVSGMSAALGAIQKLSDGVLAQSLFDQMFEIANTLEADSEGYKASLLGTMATTVMIMASSDW